MRMVTRVVCGYCSQCTPWTILQGQPFLPDFTLRHDYGRKALVELRGSWTPEYLDTKARKWFKTQPRASAELPAVITVHNKLVTTGLVRRSKSDDPIRAVAFATTSGWR